MTQPIVPAIVIAAYNRPEHLQRLCASVLAADVAAGTELIISIDGGGANGDQVRSVAASVDWPHGNSQVIAHERLGLVDHFFACGDLTADFGAVILLEDDLVVGPAFQQWATAALTHARADERIAGISLATPHFDGYRHLPFEPVIDGGDGVYAQVPWYDGMAWTHAMWSHFRSTVVDVTTPVHRSLTSLGNDEWFPHAMRYLVSTDRYYLLPRHAHATNSGAAGAHFDETTSYFQVPLTLQGPDSWRLHTLDEALAVYDDHMELTTGAVKRLVPELAAYDLTVDLLGTRDLNTVTTPFVLTTRQVTRAELQWGASMHPLVANLVHTVTGDSIRLAKRSDVIDSAESEQQSLTTLQLHANRGQSPSGRQALRTITDGIKARLTRGH